MIGRRKFKRENEIISSLTNPLLLHFPRRYYIELKFQYEKNTKF